nr:hypothetical protein [Moraxella nonliquefaciens]
MIVTAFDGWDKSIQTLINRLIIKVIHFCYANAFILTALNSKAFIATPTDLKLGDCTIGLFVIIGYNIGLTLVLSNFKPIIVAAKHAATMLFGVALLRSGVERINSKTLD